MSEATEHMTPDVPDFDLIRPIGRGGFGQVWLATNRTTGHLRAIKLIPLQQAGAGSAAAREIGSLTRLEANVHCHHPNLLVIHHVGKTASHLFYVMDPADDVSGSPATNVPGYRPATLQTRLETDSGPVKPEVRLELARQLLAGLVSLHAAGMVHRDVKPSNCLFVDGRLQLADFGLLTESHPLVSRLGTEKYMPPNGRMDMRADVYAAGLVIYEILSGQPVDDFPRLGRRSHEIVQSPVLSALLRLVLRACERDPLDRFADARAMLAELEKPIATRPPVRRRRVLWTAFTAATLAVVAAVAWTFTAGDVSVSFVTDPCEAKVYLDDVLIVDSTGAPYTTPCTVDHLTASPHRVAFESDDQQRWDAGRYDFARTHQIVSRRPE